MFKRKFDGLTESPSILGFGGMRFPVGKDGKIDCVETEKMLTYAYERGVNYFDTAYFYHGGESEIVLGKILKKFDRNKIYIADKMPGWQVKTLDDAERIFSDQLKRLDIEYFDFYLCHSLTLDGFKIYKEFLLDFLIDKMKKGFIRRLGFSYHDEPSNLPEIADYYKWDFAQLQLNYIDWMRQGAELTYKTLTDRQIPVIVMEPVRGGVLANLSPSISKILTDAEPDKSIASWAIRFAMSLPNVLTVLSGMSNMPQTIDNLNTAKDFIPLSKKEQALIDKVRQAIFRKTSIPCTGCRYCEKCHKKIDIAGLFKCYNEFLQSDDEDYNEELKRLAILARECAFCGKCALVCPQKIDIPKFIREII